MTASARIIPIDRDRPPAVESWSDLDALLAKRMADLDPDCYEGEVIQSIGLTKHNLSLGKRSGFDEVRRAIAHLVAVEQADRDEADRTDRIEAEWRDAGYDSNIEVWQQEGR